MDRLEHARQLFLEALSHHERSELGEAQRLYEEALRFAPDRPSVMNNLAAVYLQTRKYAEAKRVCERALELDPRDDQALVHLGVCLVNLDAVDDALALFDGVIARQPEEARALANRGSALLRLERFTEALASAERALSIQPHFPEALNVRGNAQMKLGRTEEALASYRGALALKPHHDESIFNAASTLLRLGREEEANKLLRDAIASRPEEAALHAIFGDALIAQHLLDQAAVQYQRALELDCASARAQYGLACVRLFEQDYERAWPGYERRFETEEYRKQSFRDSSASLRLYESLPRWQGPLEPISGGVAIWAEQGIGDQVLFSTLIPDLNAAGVFFQYEVDSRLLGTYQRAFPENRFVPRQDPPHETLQRAQRVLAAGSLPALFRRRPEDFARQPGRVFAALPGRVAHYRRMLERDEPGLKVAVSWRSVGTRWWTTKKSAILADFASVLQLPGVRFVDVQYGDTGTERAAVEAATGVRITRFQEVDHYNDLEDVLAILEACDLLVTTSNATAHFAGALGKRTWLLYLADRAPFHYWAHGGTYRSLWYPSVEIVSAPHLTSWAGLIDHARKRLAAEAVAAGG